MSFVFLEETTSTNDVARDPSYGCGDVICAEYQSAGRGQRGHRWSSRRGENLMFSLVLTPEFIPVERQFLLSQMVTLSLVETLAVYGIDATVKWTNDIYAGDRKICGMLIENDLGHGLFSRAIVGIGLNVNQREFDPELPNPTSMVRQTGREYDRRSVLQAFYDRFMRMYETVRRDFSAAERIAQEYNGRLYRLGERHPFRLPDGTVFGGVIRGVEPAGGLLVEHPDGACRSYLFKEIEFVIAGRE
ncbi:MAG: biotin--[acetyl-CoA-carboxylase] ligase [Rikenellaceae bacterium]|nr:biotin--[acetyl-CoA-carboxylase] ligase [Rikenellaceae bacterium]